MKGVSDREIPFYLGFLIFVFIIIINHSLLLCMMCVIEAVIVWVRRQLLRVERGF